MTRKTGSRRDLAPVQVGWQTILLTIAVFSISQASAQEPRPLAIPDFTAGFASQVVCSGLTGATGMAISPDGRIFICEQTGTLRLVKNGRLESKPVVSLEVDSTWERGLLGVELDPQFETNGHVYLVYVAAKPYPHHVVSRFTFANERIDLKSEAVLLEGDDQTKMGGSVPAGHQGGGIHFGADGKLYIAIGEQTAGMPSQKLDTFLGKLLRINADGTLPKDNPLFESAKGKYRAIWCYGLRNPFGFAVERSTGRILINDVGGSRWEEINEAVAGANYGWPHTEGPTTRKEHKSPLYAYAVGPKQSISGGTFYEPQMRQFPAEYEGKYFFAEYMHGWIQFIDPARPQQAHEFAKDLNGPVDLRVGPDGSLYVLCRNEWVNDHTFERGTSALVRIFHVENSKSAAPRLANASEARQLFVPLNESECFEAEADGERPLEYQWLRNDTPIAGATAERYCIERVVAGDDGAIFRCIVRNRHGAIKTPPTTVWTGKATPLNRIVRFTDASDTADARDIAGVPSPSRLPKLLSQTGIFRSLADLTPMPGVVPYDVNSPLWSDGALKRRWIILPDANHTITFSADGAWKFPPNTVFVKHFELGGEGDPPQDRRRLETRLLVVDRRGLGYGVTYRWRADSSDAELLDDAVSEEVTHKSPGQTHRQQWTYPGQPDCLACHTAAAGLVLGVNARQLNRPFEYTAPNGETRLESQLHIWSKAGMFDKPPDESQLNSSATLSPPKDEHASIEHRVRSYLDSNCAQCHRPAGARAEFDARFTVPLPKQGLIDGKLIGADLGIDDSRVVVPGDRTRSMLYLRMTRREHDAFNMPPLASHLVDHEAAELVGRWIDSLPASTAPAAK